MAENRRRKKTAIGRTIGGEPPASTERLSAWRRTAGGKTPPSTHTSTPTRRRTAGGKNPPSNKKTDRPALALTHEEDDVVEVTAARVGGGARQRQEQQCGAIAQHGPCPSTITIATAVQQQRRLRNSTEQQRRLEARTPRRRPAPVCELRRDDIGVVLGAMAPAWCAALCQTLGGGACFSCCTLSVRSLPDIKRVLPAD